MIEFKSFLAHELNAYLDYREDAGYTNRGLPWALSSLDRYLEKTGAGIEQMTSLFFLEFRRTIPGEPGTANTVFIRLRGFFDYLVRVDRLAHNPLRDIPPLAQNAYIPFVFSPDRIQALIAAMERGVRRKGPATFLRDLAAYTALFLMARCGLRVSEPLRLKREHYRPGEGTLYIEKTKFNKDRLIPVPQDVLTRIDNFLSVKQALCGKMTGPALLSARKGPISADFLSGIFHRAVSDIGAHRPGRRIGNITFSGPRPHSLRHYAEFRTMPSMKRNQPETRTASDVFTVKLGIKLTLSQDLLSAEERGTHSEMLSLPASNQRFRAKGLALCPYQCLGLFRVLWEETQATPAFRQSTRHSPELGIVPPMPISA